MRGSHSSLHATAFPHDIAQPFSCPCWGFLRRRRGGHVSGSDCGTVFYCPPTLLLHPLSLTSQMKELQRKDPRGRRSCRASGNPGLSLWQLLEVHSEGAPFPHLCCFCRGLGIRGFVWRADTGCRSETGQPLRWSACWQKGAIIQKRQDMLN